MSSISPLATKDFARRIEELGCDYVDAPVSGGDMGAREGTLTIMVGGRDAAVARVQPLFELMGRTVTHIGCCGDGQTAKVANQIIVAMTIQAVSEAFVFASKAGADVAAVRAALLGGGREFADPRTARRAHDRAQIRTGIQNLTASQGFEQRTCRCE